MVRQYVFDRNGIDIENIGKKICPANEFQRLHIFITRLHWCDMD